MTSENKATKHKTCGLFPTSGVTASAGGRLLLAFDGHHNGYLQRETLEYNALLKTIMQHYMARTRFGTQHNASCGEYRFSYLYSQDGLRASNDSMGAGPPYQEEVKPSVAVPREWSADLETLQESEMYGADRPGMLAPTGGIGEAENGTVVPTLIKPRMLDYMRKQSHYGPGVDYFPGMCA